MRKMITTRQIKKAIFNLYKEYEQGGEANVEFGQSMADFHTELTGASNAVIMLIGNLFGDALTDGEMAQIELHNDAGCSTARDLVQEHFMW